jgi:hypothetical protein
MNSPERHFTRYMDHDWGDGSFGRDDRVLYTCDEEGPNGPLYDEHFQPFNTVPIEEQSAIEEEEGIEEDNGPIPPPTGPVTLSCLRGEGLNLSWAIIKKGGVIFAEEPISHDLCDALIQNNNLLQSATGLLSHEIERLGSDPESNLVFIRDTLIATGGKPW